MTSWRGYGFREEGNILFSLLIYFLGPPKSVLNQIVKTNVALTLHIQPPKMARSSYGPSSPVPGNLRPANNIRAARSARQQHPCGPPGSTENGRKNVHFQLDYKMELECAVLSESVVSSAANFVREIPHSLSCFCRAMRRPTPDCTKFRPASLVEKPQKEFYFCEAQRII